MISFGKQRIHTYGNITVTDMSEYKTEHPLKLNFDDYAARYPTYRGTPVEFYLAGNDTVIAKCPFHNVRKQWDWLSHGRDLFVGLQKMQDWDKFIIRAPNNPVIPSLLYYIEHPNLFHGRDIPYHVVIVSPFNGEINALNKLTAYRTGRVHREHGPANTFSMYAAYGGLSKEDLAFSIVRDFQERQFQKSVDIFALVDLENKQILKIY